MYDTRMHEHDNKAFMALMSAPFIIGSLFMLIRCVTEKKLASVVTPYDAEKNEALLLSFAASKHYTVRKKTGGYIVLTDNDTWANASYTMIFFVTDKQVQFVVLTDRQRTNFPAMLSWYVLDRDLEKLYS